MKKLKVKTKKMTQLQIKEINQMWDLYQVYYSQSNFEKFVNDLYSKSHCFVGYDKNEEIKGFCLFKFYTTEFNEKKVNVLYTGDTMFHPDYWGNKSLHVAFILFCVKQILLNPQRKIYWHLISSGFRTYMAMAKSTAHYYPNYKQVTPEWERGFIDWISEKQFGSEYDKKTGLVTFKNKNEGLYDHSHSESSLSRFEISPELRYFLQKNPDYKKGVELSCVAKIGVKTFLFVWKTIIKRKFENLMGQKEKASYGLK